MDPDFYEYQYRQVYYQTKRYKSDSQSSSKRMENPINKLQHLRNNNNIDYRKYQVQEFTDDAEALKEPQPKPKSSRKPKVIDYSGYNNILNNNESSSSKGSSTSRSVPTWQKGAQDMASKQRSKGGRTSKSSESQDCCSENTKKQNSSSKETQKPSAQDCPR